MGTSSATAHKAQACERAMSTPSGCRLDYDNCAVADPIIDSFFFCVCLDASTLERKKGKKRKEKRLGDALII